MKKITVLGAGMVGRAIAIDLSKSYDVTSVDLDVANLRILGENHPVRTVRMDFRANQEIKEIIQETDLVIGAVPGFLGYETVKNVISAGKNIVDISFFPEDALTLDHLAKEAGVTAVVDCGVAPGMSNFLLGYHNRRMEVKNFEFYVGGLPLERVYPYQYKAPFSPVDVLEEYTRPARLVENGELIIKPALSDREFMNFQNIGTLEAFNTDGLRTLLYTMNIPNMKEKTLRYPGYIDIIKVLLDSGFFGTEPLEVSGARIRPIDFTSKILFPIWKLNESDEEFTVMRVIIEGVENGTFKKYVYDLFDKYDKASRISSMARTTGYTATAVANLILNGKYDRKGIIPPEFIGTDEECFHYVMEYLKERSVEYKMKTDNK